MQNANKRSDYGGGITTATPGTDTVLGSTSPTSSRHHQPSFCSASPNENSVLAESATNADVDTSYAAAAAAAAAVAAAAATGGDEGMPLTSATHVWQHYGACGTSLPAARRRAHCRRPCMSVRASCASIPSYSGANSNRSSPRLRSTRSRGRRPRPFEKPPLDRYDVVRYALFVIVWIIDPRPVRTVSYRLSGNCTSVEAGARRAASRRHDARWPASGVCCHYASTKVVTVSAAAAAGGTLLDEKARRRRRKSSGMFAFNNRVRVRCGHGCTAPRIWRTPWSTELSPTSSCLHCRRSVRQERIRHRNSNIAFECLMKVLFSQ